MLVVDLRHYSAEDQKFKKKKISKSFKKEFLLYFGYWNFLGSSLKSTYIFSKKIFSYILGENFQIPKKQKFLILQEMEFSSSKCKNKFFFLKGISYFIYFIRTFFIRISFIRIIWRTRTEVVSDFCSETKGSLFESGC